MKKEQSSLEKGKQLIVENFKQYGLGLGLEEDLYHMFQRCLKVALADQKQKIREIFEKEIKDINARLYRGVEQEEKERLNIELYETKYLLKKFEELK